MSSLRSAHITGSLLLSLALPTLARAQTAAPPPPAEGTPAAPAAPQEGPVASPSVGPSLSDLESRLADVDQRARVAERKLEILDEAAAAAKATTPVLAAGERGFNWKSPDNLFVLKVRGVLHADGRQFLEDPNLKQRGAFFMRRARPIIEATFGDWADFRLMGDFAGAPTLVDGFVDIRPFAWLKLRVGKFKPPVGLERLQSAAAILFPERALPTSLAPNRDVGAMVHGVIGPGILTYEIGVWNGTIDGATSDGDTQNAKDFAGRLFLQPLKFDPYHLLANLGVGIAGSTGKQFDAVGAQANPPALAALLPAFRSSALQGVTGAPAFFQYPAGIIARGRRTRLSPQGFFYYGPFGLLAEYIQSAQKVDKGGARTTFTHRAWQVASSVVLGGKPLFEGVTVTSPFNLKTGDLGALEIAARYHELRVDEDALALDASNRVLFVDPARFASRASSFGAQLGWHWSKNLKLTLAYENTRWKGGAAAGGDRATEHALYQRVQVAF